MQGYEYIYIYNNLVQQIVNSLTPFIYRDNQLSTIIKKKNEITISSDLTYIVSIFEFKVELSKFFAKRVTCCPFGFI